MLPSIQSIPVYGFLFHPTKITSWGEKCPRIWGKNYQVGRK
jgi:hypothetical protein